MISLAERELSRRVESVASKERGYSRKRHEKTESTLTEVSDLNLVLSSHGNSVQDSLRHAERKVNQQMGYYRSVISRNLENESKLKSRATAMRDEISSLGYTPRAVGEDEETVRYCPPEHQPVLSLELENDLIEISQIREQLIKQLEE
jgi:hypothetical protein